MTKKKFLSVLLLAFSVLAIPGCKWFNQAKEKVHCATCPLEEKASHHNDGSPVLINVNGKPALTAKEFEDFINKAVEGNEQVKLWMQFVPDFKEQVFKSKLRSVTINEWAKKEGIRNTKEYRDKEKVMMDSIRDSLDLEEFVKRHDVEINDDEAKKYYEENKKQDPRIMISAEGVKASGVSLKNQTETNEFAEAVKKNNGSLDKLAKEKKLTVTPFGIVNDESVIDAKIKEKVNATKTFPNVIVVKDEKGKFWVVVAQSKEKAQFRPFDQVKDLVKKLLKPKKLEEILEKEATKLEKEYNITHDNSYFEAQRKKAESDAQEAMKALAKNQPDEKQTSEQPVKELAIAKAA